MEFCGGYDQYYFVNIFQTTFLCAAIAGTILWTVEVILIIYRSYGFFQRLLNRSKVERRPYGENTKKLKNSSLSERMGLIVRFLIGLMEDLPVVIVLYYTVALPLCEIPVKVEGSSPTTIAQVGFKFEY